MGFGVAKLNESIGLALLACVAFAAPAGAEGISTSVNGYGMPGMIDMPVATSRDDADLVVSFSRFQIESRTALSFQVTPRLSGAFRYSFVGGGLSYDRSFSLHYRLLDEGRFTPAVAFGLNDMIGTGLYSGEYVVATKTVAPTVRVSGGIGWGRLGSYNGFTNPLGAINHAFEVRPGLSGTGGGQFEVSQWFRGDAALFGGVEWQATDRLRFTAEYSSDAYPRQDGNTFDRASPYNFGLTYQYSPAVALSARYLYGSELGLQATFVFNPKERPKLGSGLDPAPSPVRVRGQEPLVIAQGPLDQRLQRELKAQGITLNALRVDGAVATAEIWNETYSQDAQAIGRTARVMTRLMPDSVERFTIILSRGGLPVTEALLNRKDLETLEFDMDGTEFTLARATVRDRTTGLVPLAGRYPNYDFGLIPYVQPSYFDPDNPVRADFGIAGTAKIEPLPGLRFSGRIQQKLIGNLDESKRSSDSVLPHVRSDANRYDKNGSTAITELTGAYYFRPAPQMFGRVTIGYLERMYGGLSTEVLWKPDGKRYALGAELNYVVQRDFDGFLGFRDFNTVTGMVSGYYELPNDFHLRLDVGRYLAGDVGATFAVDREFENGVKVGAFATLTDVPFADFGEGSFDKGIRVVIPLDWLGGRPSRDQGQLLVRPILRDGGAQVNVAGRLYEEVRGAKNTDILDGWGRFWQ